MEETITSNSRIAKNTIILYLRMVVILLVGLYSSRVILNALGVVDYGIYNIVGSIVVLFSYLDSALSLATTRFYSYELPYGIERVKTVYNTSMIVQIAFALIILLIAETLGLWLVNYKLVIPLDRLGAANWVYQFSLITTFLSIISIPFNSAITSHEKMSVYAVISTLEALLKLLVALAIVYSPIDYLVFYGLGLLVISLLLFFVKYIYCKRKFEEVKFEWQFSRPLFKKMFAFVGWNFFGATAGVSVGQGLNFIINIFFGPAINAARGIAFQVQGAMNQFINNINTAVNPQIVKRYSIGEIDSMFKLVFFSSKISFLLLTFVSMPILVDAPIILKIWLKEVPDQTVLFTRLMLVYMITLSLTYSVNMSAQASGNIKKVQLAEGCIVLLNLPVVYILFLIGQPAYVSFISMIIFSIISFMAKLIILSKTIDFPVKKYLETVLSRITIISFFCLLVYCISVKYSVNTFVFFLVKTIMYSLPVFVFIWFIGFQKNERSYIISLVQKWIKTKKNI